MKKLKTRNEYVGCNGKARYYVDEDKATSYGHWDFVAEINGKVIFNDYRYSQTTSRHQREVAWLLDDLGVKVDATVRMGESLNQESFERTALDYFYNLAILRIIEIHTKRVHASTKEDNRKVIAIMKKKIKELREIGADISWSKVYRMYRTHKKRRDDRQERIAVTQKYNGKIYRREDGSRWKVVGKGHDFEMLLLKDIDNNNRRTSVWLQNFNKSFKYCPLSNVL